MNVYDFDKTIYNGDSTYDFYMYSIKKNPKTLFKVHNAIGGAIKHYVFKRCSKTQFKEKIYTFLKYANTEKEVELFWNKNEHKIKKWYLKNKKDDDVIISASPEFLLKDICKRLDIKYLIASKVDSNSGKYTGENCYGEEKVKRFYKEIKNGKINEFYSDSYSDSPLAKIAEKSYLVVGDELKEW